MARRPAKSKSRTSSRPRRGTVEGTRERLVAAAAEEFATAGFDGTDSTKISTRAGYAAGTFYKHFEDKREIFIAAYARWVDNEWTTVREVLGEYGDPKERSKALVHFYLDLHAKSRVFRASLRVLAATDAVVRREYQAQRKRQLDWLKQIRGGRKTSGRERDALLLYTLERAGDALADGEDKVLGLNRAALGTLIEDLLESAFRD